MKASSLLGHCAQLLKIVWKSPQPADAVTSEFLRSKKYIGSKERKAISEIVFTTLRIHGFVEHCNSVAHSESLLPNTLPEQLRICTGILVAYKHNLYPAETLITKATGAQPVEQNFTSILTSAFAELCSADVEATTTFIQTVSNCIDESEQQLQQTLQHAEAQEQIETLAWGGSMQPWIVEDWLQTYSPHDVYNVCTSLCHSAPLTARVNTRIINRENALAMLTADGISVSPTTLSPHGILFAERTQLTQHPLFQSGTLEIQDEGSQLVGYALSPEQHWRVLDACAGAGGKSLHVATLQNNHGHVWGSDIEPKRLRELHFRAQKSALTSIMPRALTTVPDNERNKLHESFDAVLIDAPCSGMGTVRRSPMLKWRLTADQLQRINNKQRGIIAENAKYVRPGGVLLYVTCSLMHQENENIVNEFLATHPEFVPDALAPQFAKHGITIPHSNQDDWHVTLTPYHHHTDGFFIARMKRLD